MQQSSPQDFGYFRSRWSCALLAETLAWEEKIRVSGEAVRRGLAQLGWVWRRPRPVVGLTDPEYEKRHVSGLLHWRTGKLFVSAPTKRRNSQQFVEHLDDLCHNLRSYSKLHVICDNAIFHRSRAVQKYLADWGHRICLHFFPKYAPETNPIERVWWHLHETITRNHRCSSLEELLDQAYSWFAQNNTHYFEMRKIFALAA